MTADDNILKFCREEVDAFVLPPEPPGHPSRALLADLRGRSFHHMLLLGTAVSLAIAGGIAAGTVAVWIAEPPRLPVTEIAARPVEQAPAELQAQLRAWWASRNAEPPPPQPHPVHR
jgi:hypothetical protein